MGYLDMLYRPPFWTSPDEAGNPASGAEQAPPLNPYAGYAPTAGPGVSRPPAPGTDVEYSPAPGTGMGYLPASDLGYSSALGLGYPSAFGLAGEWREHPEGAYQGFARSGDGARWPGDLPGSFAGYLSGRNASSAMPFGRGIRPAMSTGSGDLSDDSAIRGGLLEVLARRHNPPQPLSGTHADQPGAAFTAEDLAQNRYGTGVRPMDVTKLGGLLGIMARGEGAFHDPFGANSFQAGEPSDDSAIRGGLLEVLARRHNPPQPLSGTHADQPGAAFTAEDLTKNRYLTGVRPMDVTKLGGLLGIMARGEGAFHDPFGANSFREGEPPDDSAIRGGLLEVLARRHNPPQPLSGTPADQPGAAITAEDLAQNRYGTGVRPMDVTKLGGLLGIMARGEGAFHDPFGVNSFRAGEPPEAGSPTTMPSAGTPSAPAATGLARAENQEYRQPDRGFTSATAFAEGRQDGEDDDADADDNGDSLSQGLENLVESLGSAGPGGDDGPVWIARPKGAASWVPKEKSWFRKFLEWYSPILFMDGNDPERAKYVKEFNLIMEKEMLSVSKGLMIFLRMFMEAPSFTSFLSTMKAEDYIRMSDAHERAERAHEQEAEEFIENYSSN